MPAPCPCLSPGSSRVCMHKRAACRATCVGNNEAADRLRIGRPCSGLAVAGGRGVWAEASALLPSSRGPPLRSSRWGPSRWRPLSTALDYKFCANPLPPPILGEINGLARCLRLDRRCFAAHSNCRLQPLCAPNPARGPVAEPSACLMVKAPANAPVSPAGWCQDPVRTPTGARGRNGGAVGVRLSGSGQSTRVPAGSLRGLSVHRCASLCRWPHRATPGRADTGGFPPSLKASLGRPKSPLPATTARRRCRAPRRRRSP
jgi:hypothetical protein